MPASERITQRLVDWSNGDQAALDEVLPLVYDELRRLADSYLRRERPDHTLQPTALVHEAYLRLIGQKNLSWQNRAHFFGIAARVMRQILVNHALNRNADKRGGHLHKVSLDEAVNFFAERDVNLMALNRALDELEALDPRQSQIVELRFFGGLSIEEAAEVLGISPATVKRDWSIAKLWLHRAIEGTQE